MNISAMYVLIFGIENHNKRKYQFLFKILLWKVFLPLLANFYDKKNINVKNLYVKNL